MKMGRGLRSIGGKAQRSVQDESLARLYACHVCLRTGVHGACAQGPRVRRTMSRPRSPRRAHSGVHPSQQAFGYPGSSEHVARVTMTRQLARSMLCPPIDDVLPRPKPDPPTAPLDSRPREVVVAVQIGRHAVVVSKAENRSDLARAHKVIDLHLSCHGSSL